MKYIMIESDIPILFGQDIAHKKMADCLATVGQVTSAGFVDIVDGEAQAYGRSDSLDLSSGPIDSVIITDMVGEDDNAYAEAF